MSEYEGYFWCIWYARATTLDDCKGCYDHIRGECDPREEERLMEERMARDEDEEDWLLEGEEDDC